MKRLLTTVALFAAAVVSGGTMSLYSSAQADTSEYTYTIQDARNLQDFLLAKPTTDDLTGKPYDMNNDGRWDVFDLCLMRQEVAEIMDTADSNTLVVYYSASGTTEKIADYIVEAMNADTFVITPIQPYSDADLDWTDQTSRVVMEHNDENRHTELVSVDVTDWESYDNVFIGYPIWWQEASWVVDDFVKENDFTGKNVIPFCTSMSSPLGDSGTLLAEMAGTGNWLEGMRFTSSSTKESVQSWAKGLDLPKQEQKNDILIAYFTPAENSGVDAISSATLTTWNGEDMGAAQVLANMINDHTRSDMFSIRTEVNYSQNSTFSEQGDYRKAMPQFQADSYEKNRALFSLIQRYAEDKNATPAQISLAWLICKKPYIVPIPGTRKLGRLTENLGAADVVLTAQEIAEIDKALIDMEMSDVFGGAKIVKK